MVHIENFKNYLKSIDRTNAKAKIAGSMCEK